MQYIFTSNQVVILVDRSTTLPICGVDTIQLKIGIHILEIETVLYVYRLDDTLFSITEHIKYKYCPFIGDDNKYTLKFQTFSIPAKIINEVFIPYEYAPNNNKVMPFSTKSSHNVLNNNDQHTNNIITTIPPFTIEITISSSNSYSTIYSPMSEPHNRKVCENITNYKARNDSITLEKYSILNDI